MRLLRYRFPWLVFCGLVFVFVLGTPDRANAQVPSRDGQWASPFSLPLIAIHAALLPTGNVLLFSAEHGVPGIHGWVLNPTTLGLTNVPPPPPWNPDCAGHSFLPDGRLLVAGGTLSFGPLTGTNKAFTFHPWFQQWTPIEDMRGGRWYPTNVTLADGSIVTMAGLSSVPGVRNPDIERWNPVGTSNWELLGRKTLPYYPLLHLLPGGEIFMAGPASLAERFDPISRTWTPVASTGAPGRYEAPSVLLPPTLNRVMVIGGYPGSGEPTDSAEIIDLDTQFPAWRYTTTMGFRRFEHNAVVLPDGQVLVVGGRSHNSNTNPSPVLVPEIFDPTTERWLQVAPHTIPRRYHSTALLLPDGRVLVAGGDYQPTGEIYSPPYLFRGPRPQIIQAPDAILLGASFNLAFSSPTATSTVALLALSTVTHSVAMGERYVRLGQFTGGGPITVPAPSDGRVAPPGYYMLFVVDASGVPSISRIVRVVRSLGDYVPLGNALPGTNGVPVLTARGSFVGASTVSFDLGNGLPGVSAILVLGLSRIDRPLLGGVLVPSPDLVVQGLPISNMGTAAWPIICPLGLFTGFTVYLQYWFPDQGAVQGYAASNALRATAP